MLCDKCHCSIKIVCRDCGPYWFGVCGCTDLGERNHVYKVSVTRGFALVVACSEYDASKMFDDVYEVKLMENLQFRPSENYQSVLLSSF